ncbi:hypothetical protein Acr_16g0006100 [Actinidia rufa]|uniref:Uncharacterized protein n=1 Tax=Actinidia rufa TaxID=165716 RepID=A0A7J0FZ80_9ERIC|nr:hypothetical protein Acr_16g0006100 [Actinidia rufa]
MLHIHTVALSSIATNAYPPPLRCATPPLPLRQSQNFYHDDAGTTTTPQQPNDLTTATATTMTPPPSSTIVESLFSDLRPIISPRPFHHHHCDIAAFVTFIRW